MGCTLSKDACSVTCAKGMPLPASKSCSINILWGSIFNGSVVLMLGEQVPSDRAILYISENDRRSFRGLSYSEKQEIKSLGITHVDIRFYNTDTGDSSSYTKGYVKVEDVSLRGEVVQKGGSIVTNPAEERIAQLSESQIKSNWLQQNAYIIIIAAVVVIISLLVVVLAVK